MLQPPKQYPANRPMHQDCCSRSTHTASMTMVTAVQGAHCSIPQDTPCSYCATTNPFRCHTFHLDREFASRSHRTRPENTQPMLAMKTQVDRGIHRCICWCTWMTSTHVWRRTCHPGTGLQRPPHSSFRSGMRSAPSGGSHPRRQKSTNRSQPAQARGIQQDKTRMSCRTGRHSLK